MSDFNEDLNTPTEADLDAAYGSKYLSAAEVGNKRIKAKIKAVGKALLQQQGGTARLKFILSFTGTDKDMVLNTTNKNTLVDALGRNPAKWIGCDVGIFTEPTSFGGKPTRGLRLRVLFHPATAPTPKPAADEPMPWDSEGDPLPGFDNAAE